MSTLSKLFSGYTGGGNTAKNGKFSTSKNNHNRNKDGRSSVMYGYSRKFLELWFSENELKKLITEAKIAVENFNVYNEASYIYSACERKNSHDNLPSYMNPIYRPAYHQPKRRY